MGEETSTSSTPTRYDIGRTQPSGAKKRKLYTNKNKENEDQGTTPIENNKKTKTTTAVDESLVPDFLSMSDVDTLLQLPNIEQIYRSNRCATIVDNRVYFKYPPELIRKYIFIKQYGYDSKTSHCEHVLTICFKDEYLCNIAIFDSVSIKVESKKLQLITPTFGQVTLIEKNSIDEKEILPSTPYMYYKKDYKNQVWNIYKMVLGKAFSSDNRDISLLFNIKINNQISTLALRNVRCTEDIGNEFCEQQRQEYMVTIGKNQLSNDINELLDKWANVANAVNTMGGDLIWNNIIDSEITELNTLVNNIKQVTTMKQLNPMEEKVKEHNHYYSILMEPFTA